MAIANRTSITVPSQAAGFVSLPRTKGSFLYVHNTGDSIVTPALSWGTLFTLTYRMRAVSLPGSARLLIGTNSANHIMQSVSGFYVSHSGVQNAGQSAGIETGVFHNYVIVFDGAATRTFRDGIPVTNIAFANSPNLTSQAHYIFNNQVGDRPCDGYVEDFCYYSRAFTPEEVATHHFGARNFTNCELRYKLDEGSGAVANDSSGNNRHAVINNCSWVTL